MEGSLLNSVNASSQDDFQDDQATAERATAAIRIVTDALDALGETGFAPRTPKATPRVFPIAYGWFAAVVRNGQLIALAHENGLRNECAASGRLVLQHTLALQWLIEGGDPAAAAVEADGQRRAFDLGKELTDTGWPLPPGYTVWPGHRPAQAGALEEQFGNFKAMCALYDGGLQQYVPFRLQSSRAHPSAIGAKAYIVPETGAPSRTAVTGTYAYLLDTARCVILAGHAFALLLTDTSLADAVTRAETALGLEFPLGRRL